MILFLDFDGVLHPMNRSNGVLSQLKVFEEFIRNHPNIDIVISSSWRTDHSLEKLKSFFSEDVSKRIIGITPNRYDGFHTERYQREKEIEDWLREEGREYESRIILDDCDWMFSPHCRGLFLIDPEIGFTSENAEKLTLKFNQNILKK